MKLLLDQNLSRKLLPALLARYPDSNHVLLLRLQKADDSDIWYYAQYHLAKSSNGTTSAFSDFRLTTRRSSYRCFS